MPPAFVMVVAAVWLVAGCDSPGRPTPPQFSDGESCSVEGARFAGLTIAGSGSALALAHIVTQAYRDSSSGAVDTWIPPSIGSGGAIRAVRDGAVDIGLVTRPLKPSEAGPDLVLRPWLEGRVVLVGQPGLGVETLDLATAEAMLSGAVRHWSDGTPVVPLGREPGDSGELVISDRRPALFRAIREAVSASRALELHTDQDMRDALLGIRGALGTLDWGTVQLESLPLAVSKPSLEAAWWRPFYLLHRAEPTAEVKAFVDFARSPAGRAAAGRAGYRPATRARP